MDRVLLLAILLCFRFGSIPVDAASGGVRAIHALGQDYLPLKDWAESWQLDFKWIRKEDEFLATNKTVALVFKLNSQRAEINGVNSFLSFPIMIHNGVPLIASQDADHLLRPILRPPRNNPVDRIKTVALCPGHGGKDPGFQVGADQEKRYTLLLAKEVQQRLIEAGFKVVMLRDSDRTVGYEDRVSAAKRRQADVYVSLHYNSAGPQATEVRGTEVYCLTLPGSHSTNGGAPRAENVEPGDRNNDKNVFLAYQIQKSLVQNLRTIDRGIRRARFVVLRLAEMPAVLIETTFMSNPEEMKHIKDSTHRKRTAQAIVNGLLAYKRQIER